MKEYIRKLLHIPIAEFMELQWICLYIHVPFSCTQDLVGCGLSAESGGLGYSVSLQVGLASVKKGYALEKQMIEPVSFFSLDFTTF